MYSIFNALKRQQISGNETKVVKSALQNKLLTNLKEDNYTCTTISLEDDVCLHAQCDNFAAIIDKKCILSLYDVAIGRKLWSAPVNYIPNDEDHKLIVSKTGLVLYGKTTYEYDTSSEDEEEATAIHFYAQFFLDGEKTGEFKKTIKDKEFAAIFYPDTIRISNNRIFGISLITSSKEKKLLEWNMEGKLVNTTSISIEGLVHFSKAHIEVNDHLYILCVKDPLNKLTIFILNLHNSNDYKTAVFLEDEILSDIYEIKLLNDKLVISLKTTNSKIAILNPYTCEFSNYSIADKRNFPELYNVTANNTHVIFLRDSGTAVDLLCLNIKNGIYEIIQLPFFFLGSQVRISLTGPLLTICTGVSMHTSKRNDDYVNKQRVQRYVIDIDDLKTLKKLIYEADTLKAFVSNNLFTVITKENAKNMLYAENFEHLETANEGIKSPGPRQ